MNNSVYRELLDAVRFVYGYDFTEYSEASVKRRIDSFINERKIKGVGYLRDLIVGDERLFEEFIQGIFAAGESFGEPALIGGFPYPGSVQAIETSKVWKLSGDYFLQMLKENFDLHLKMTQVLCQRLRYKSMVLSEISSHDPDHRIFTLLKYYKAKNTKPGENIPIRIPYTRQQIADMSGLRVETVIRTVKKMEKEGKLVLEGHKIVF